jgi:hypothetical protein
MVLADWLSETESDVTAALALEPLDVDGELSDVERETWDDRLGAVTVKFEMDVPEQARRSLRETLAEQSPLYRRTRADLMHPRSQDGQALAAALDSALDDGAVGSLLAFGG